MEIGSKAGPSHPSLSLPLNNESVSQVLRSIDALEARLYSIFSEIEHHLEDCERTSIQAIHKTIEDIRVENEESMEAVQLDLELLRQKVRNQSLALDAAQLLQPELTDAIISCKINLNAEKFTRYLLENIERTIKLPSTCLNLQEDEDERVLFAISARGEEGIPFATVLQNANITESSQSSEEIVGEPEEEDRTTEGEKQRTAGRLLVVTLCVIAVGVTTRFIVSRLVQR